MYKSHNVSPTPANTYVFCGFKIWSRWEQTVE